MSRGTTRGRQLICAASAAVGAAVGAASASSATAVATTGAYNAGVAAGLNQAAAIYALRQIATTLPAGCATPDVQGRAYYLCGNTWFSPAYGGGGVYDKVVPAP
jgi:hypothetical protein